jgi:Thiamine pyrophosphate-requiring enzymes [acetolactate synthase, pyruvate dehydrogenase (cytochrome), glyoxylate carboligase, phosphonopyruvate decarboxylase]
MSRKDAARAHVWLSQASNALRIAVATLTKPLHTGGKTDERRRARRRNSQARGTEFLACYPRNPLIEACAALDIRPILCRQERVGVGMADGYTRIKRGKRNGVFAAQAGPGIENAFPGIAQAYSENVPLLVIPAGLPLARQYVRPTFRAADVYRRSPSGRRWRMRSRNCRS